MCVVPTCESISGTRVCPTRTRVLRVHACTHTMLRASYTYTAFHRSTSLLKLSKKSCVSACGSAHDRASEYSRLDMKKCRELEACLPPSESFIASLRSVNSAVLIKKYDSCVNCLLSRSCHHCAISYSSKFSWFKIFVKLLKTT